MSRYLGVDYGSKRIGLAISDGLGLTAQPLQVVERVDLDATLRRLDDMYRLERVIIGLPVALAGYEGESAAAARGLGRHIESLLDVEVAYVDERFTSRIAESALLQSGMKRRDRKTTVDKVAAAIILQTYLDERSRGNSSAGDTVEPGETE